MINLPWQLRNQAYRFYLIKKDSKRPIEKLWTKTKNYFYDNPKLKRHIKQDNNYGLVCGYGSIIVIDFDSKEYYDEVKDKLPKTFTVITAGKRLPHLYYHLIDCPQKIKKMKVDDDKKNRLCDIQTSGCGVVAPGSIIGRRYYEPNDEPIRDITLFQIFDIFKIEKLEKKKDYIPKPNKTNTDNKDISLAVLHVCDVDTKVEGNMKCPFHPMNGAGNLSILDSGMIYCFHETKQWWSDQFISQYMNIDLRKAKMIVGLITNLYNEVKENAKR